MAAPVRELHLENMKAYGRNQCAGVPARELTSADIAAMAIDRLHDTFHERDMERTLRGRFSSCGRSCSSMLTDA